MNKLLYLKLKQEADIQLSCNNYEWQIPKVDNAYIERLISIYYHNNIPNNIANFNLLELDVPYTKALEVIDQDEWDYLKQISLFEYRVR